MISLRNVSLNIPEEDYHAHYAWSYSVIAKYAKEGFASMATLHDRTEPTPSMEFGSLFDSFITKGKATLDDYIVMNSEVPQAEKRTLTAIAQMSEETNLMNVNNETINRACAETEYYPKWGFDARFKHLNEYESYYRAIKYGKKTTSKKDWDDAVEMYRIFRNDDYLKTLFGTNDTEDIEYIYQPQYIIPYVTDNGKNVMLKIMLDLIVVNHKDKTVQPVDLKTSSVPAWNFKENFIKFRYDIQAHLYSYVLRHVMDANGYEDYSILPYIFTDISRSDKVPVSYRYNQFADDQLDGFTYYIGDRTYHYKSWNALLDEILAYEESNAVVPNNIHIGEPNDLLEAINTIN